MTHQVLARRFTVHSLAGLTAGLAAGIAAHRSGNRFLIAAANVVEPLGTAWTNALQMIVYPLIVSLLVVAVGSLGPGRRTGRLGAISFLLFLFYLAAAGAFTAAVSPPLVRAAPLEWGALRAGGAGAESEALPSEPASPPDFRDWLVEIVPANPLEAAAQGKILPVVVFTLMFAFALGRLRPEVSEPVVGFFRGVADTSMVLVSWILKLILFGAFAVAFPLATEVGTEAAGSVGLFVLLVCALMIVFTLALYPVTAVLGRVPVRRFARAVAPAQAVALGSRSSLASLPPLLEGAKGRLRLAPSVADFVLPLSVSTFKVNRTMSSPFKLLFLAHLYGVTIDPGYLIAFVGIIMLISFSSPGIPSGGFLVTLPFYLSAGIPIQGVILLQAVDVIPDIFKTLVNVTADMSVATVAAHLDST